MHKHMDYFIARMQEKGLASEGVPLVRWMHWLAFDLSADVGWNEQMHSMRDGMPLPLPALCDVRL
jgi:hypothetical protein